jgi:hypothetical protein
MAIRLWPSGIAAGLLAAAALGVAGPARQQMEPPRDCLALQPAIGEERRLTEVERITLDSISDTTRQAAYTAALMVKYQLGPNVVIDRQAGTIRPVDKCMEWSRTETPKADSFSKRLLRR